MWCVVPVCRARPLARGLHGRGAACSSTISLFMEIPQLIRCGISMIMERAAAPPGQPGRNGHAGPGAKPDKRRSQRHQPERRPGTSCRHEMHTEAGLVAPRARIAPAWSPPRPASPWPCRPDAKTATATTRAPASASTRRSHGASARRGHGPLMPSAVAPRDNAAGHRASAVWRCRTAAASPQRRFSHGARRQSRPPVPTHRPPEISGNIGRATKNPAEKARHAGQSSARLLCTRARSPNFRQVRGRGPGEQPQARPPVGERRSEYEQA